MPCISQMQMQIYPLKERKKSAEVWISGSGCVEHPAPQEKGSVKADQEVYEAERKWPGSVQGYDGGT